MCAYTIFTRFLKANGKKNSTMWHHTDTHMSHQRGWNHRSVLWANGVICSTTRLSFSVWTNTWGRWILCQWVSQIFVDSKQMVWFRNHRFYSRLWRTFVHFPPEMMPSACPLQVVLVPVLSIPHPGFSFQSQSPCPAVPSFPPWQKWSWHVTRLWILQELLCINQWILICNNWMNPALIRSLRGSYSL